jgi:hypothetical protein
LGSRRSRRKKRTRRNGREGGKKRKTGWIKASPSHMVQINGLNKRVKCGDEMDGAVVVRE